MIKTAIIEDSKALSGLYEQYLQETDFDVWLFSSETEDINTLMNEGDFDLIVCPGFPKFQSGSDIVQAIKSDPDLSKAALVISSTMQKECIRSEWDLRDIDTLLIKPFDKKSLTQTLDNALRARPGSNRPRPLVLVVDDSKAVRGQLGTYLKELNYDVATAPNGMEGLEMVSEILPDLILADVEMPVMDGFEFCRKLSAEPGIKHIPVIVVSGTINESQFRKGFRAGAIDFLEKPVSKPSLSAIIESVAVHEQNRADGTTVILSQDSTLAGILTKSLNFLNSSINQCTDLEELETYLCVAAPDIIILDLCQNPEKLSVCSRVRAMVGSDSVVILAVADEQDRDLMFQCFKYGATEFIIKPFGRDEVKARLENHIKLKKLQDELVKKNKILESLAYKDKLTGLMNRRYFDNALKEELDRAKQTRTDLSFLMIDLDNFKQVNDDFGHHIGDMVLKEVAAMIKDNVLENAIPCRYGGEEFCVIYPGTGLSDAMKNGEKIKRYCSVRPISQHRIYQTISGGVSSYPRTSTRDELLVHADLSLYKAKEQGKNRIVSRQKEA